jgi:glycosyl transferase, family 25
MHILPKCFVITIETEEGARRQSAIRQLNSIGIDFRFVEGCLPDDSAVNICYDATLNYWRMKRPLSRGEVAVYLSHRRALAAFIETDAEFALILEDDFGLVEPDHFLEDVIRILRAPIRWDLVKLFDFQGPKRPRALLDLGRIAIVEYKSPTAGMVGYLVRRSGAEKLISRPILFRVIDEDIKLYWEIDLFAFSVIPNVLNEISGDLGGSTIEFERNRLRDDRSVGRSVRGTAIKFVRKWNQFLNRRRYGLAAAMKAYHRGEDAGINPASDQR